MSGKRAGIVLSESQITQITRITRITRIKRIRGATLELVIAAHPTHTRRGKILLPQRTVQSNWRGLVDLLVGDVGCRLFWDRASCFSVHLRSQVADADVHLIEASVHLAA